MKSQAVTSVWVRLPEVAIPRTCPNMTVAVERDVKHQFDVGFEST